MLSPHTISDIEAQHQRDYFCDSLQRLYSLMLSPSPASNHQDVPTPRAYLFAPAFFAAPFATSTGLFCRTFYHNTSGPQMCRCVYWKLDKF